jgi:gluconokinase
MVQVPPPLSAGSVNHMKEEAVKPHLDVARIKPKAIVIMGVSGSGKSTLGALLADTLGCRFLEGDSFHCDAAVAKMRAGSPLDDDDRWPWLDRLGTAMGTAVETDGLVVAACSALKHSYRIRLRQAVEAPLCFILPEADRDELARRLHNRPGHYMPPSLLASQLDALERPGADEPVLALDAKEPPSALCDASLAWLALPVPNGTL